MVNYSSASEFITLNVTFRGLLCGIAMCDVGGLLLTPVFDVDFLLFQIEDAMLMFDKQTNRHRGKFSFTFLYKCSFRNQMILNLMHSC